MEVSNAIEVSTATEVSSATEVGPFGLLPNHGIMTFYTAGVVGDISGTNYVIAVVGGHLPVISGTTWPFVTVQIPIGHALDGIGPFVAGNNYYIPDYSPNTDNQLFYNEFGMVAYSSAQTDTDAVKVFEYLKEPFWSDGLVSALDVFNASINRGVVLTTSYAGDQYLDGVNIGANPAVSSEGLDIGPAYTELFNIASTAPAIKTLTAQDYCLQVADGSATCSYGTATPSAPLQFTATAGDVTFTPTDCTLWNLTAAGGYVFKMIPIGATKGSSSATSGGSGAGQETDDKILGALRGVPDGVELWVDPVTQTTDENNYSTYDAETGIGRIVSDGTYVQLIAPRADATRYLADCEILGTPTGSIKSTGAAPLVTSRLEELSATTSITISRAATPCDVSFKLSYQKLLPATCTVRTTITTGASSTEITEPVNITSVRDSISDILFFDAGGTIKSSDGTTIASVTVAGGWERIDKIHAVMECNGTTFKVGYVFDGGTTITWGTPVASDGSFNPGTHLREGYLNTIPSRFNNGEVYTISGLADSRILNPLEVTV